MCSSFKQNIWGTDLANIQLINKYNKGIQFLCAIDVFSKYPWVATFKEKKGYYNYKHTFQNIIDKFRREPNKIWGDKGSEFYNRSTKSCLQNNEEEMYATHN